VARDHRLIEGLFLYWSLAGMRTNTVVPFPGDDSISSVPPSNATRSLIPRTLSWQGFSLMA
jgi:hypothetical protein